LPRKRSGSTGAPTSASTACTLARLMIETKPRGESVKRNRSGAVKTFGGPAQLLRHESAKERL
jgi:hypothetical protein